jgi:ubiquinone biosynthesis protein
MPAAQQTNVAIAAKPLPRPERTRRISSVRRVAQAHIVTFVVLASYLWLRFMARYRSHSANEARLEQANRRNARRIYRTIVQLQGLYIKVGQLFSVMANFLPEAFRHELASLQDKVPARSYEAIEQRIRDEFDGQGPDALFEQFDPVPIASASIGQVHRAVLPGGHQVAVKVQYPDIERIVRADLVTLRRIFKLVQRFVPYHAMDSIYEEISQIVLEELDFTAEARNAEQVASAFEGIPRVCFPRVVPELTTRRVLTTEFVDAVKINDADGLARLGVNRTELAKLVIEAYCHQIFDHGRYHADPHPGNILVGEGPTITFVDFGSVGELSDNMRHGLVSLLQAAINRLTRPSRLPAALAAPPADPQGRSTQKG